MFSSQEICSWCDYSTLHESHLKTAAAHHSDLELHDSESSSSTLSNTEILSLQPSKRQSQQPPRKQSLVTFVSQVSMDRLTVLERSLQTWTGAVSIAIHIPVKSLADGIQDWQRLYINKKISSLNISLVDSSILLVPSLEADSYPINRLRNLAIKMVRTKFMFLVDADFQPSPGLEPNFAMFLHKHHHNLQMNMEQNESQRLAFVVPAFEYLETPNVSIFCCIYEFCSIQMSSIHTFSERRSNLEKQR